ncbi:hypothetical protein ACFYPC_36720 [Streptomyces sp. NPDC005808]|uniref:hypothetical protein n=1 Tax=Streptomyces sp. NPDC005808 TaxID=3364734 RepID=UPI0036A800C5
MPVFTNAEPGSAITLSGSPEEGFTTLYGIPTVPLGVDGEGLMALGHVADRAVLAVTNSYYRRVYGHRILPSSELTDLTHRGTQRIWIHVTRCDDDHDYAWEFEEADATSPGAQVATTIAVEWLTYEDVAVQSQCPACDRRNGSTSLTTGPGRAGWGHYHRCRNCSHTWPTAPALRPTLTKHRTWSPSRPDGCFACNCLPEYPCTDGCTIHTQPPIGQQLCTTCRAQHPADTWKQLTAVAYGTAASLDLLDEQRDRWLYSEALRGIPPKQAAQSWQHRLALTNRRASARAETTDA